MTQMLKTLALTALLAGATLAAGAPVLAQTASPPVNPAREAANRAQEAGTVGEGADGYLAFVGLRDAAPVELQRAVASINAGRRGVYTELSTTRTPAQTVDQWAMTIAVQQIARLPEGRMLRDQTGEWCAKTSATRALVGTDGTVTIRCR
jgi:uncharacterized protein YdbL (DUF1318 family)